MGESKQNRHKKAPVKQLTAEEQAAYIAAQAARVAELKAEQERLHLYGATLPKLSFRQLRGELVRTIKREHSGKPPEPQAGLTIAFASVLLTVLENTKTVENPWAKLHSYPR
jgi:hypothetical protein